MSFHSEKLRGFRGCVCDLLIKRGTEATAYGSDLRVTAQCLRRMRLCCGTAGFHFSLILTSPCHVINSMSATDHKVSAVQWIIPRPGAWSLASPGDRVGLGHAWMSSQKWHLNSTAWCWVMGALTCVSRQLLNTDGWWAWKLQADVSGSPGANWPFSLWAQHLCWLFRKKHKTF